MQRRLLSALGVVGFVLGLTGAAIAAESNLPDKMEKPKGFPERPMTVICPYGPAGEGPDPAGHCADHFQPDLHAVRRKTVQRLEILHRIREEADRKSTRLNSSH